MACGLTTSNKVMNEIIMRKYNKCSKLHQKDQQTINFFDKLYRKSVQDFLFWKNVENLFVIFFTEYWDETKTESSLYI